MYLKLIKETYQKYPTELGHPYNEISEIIGIDNLYELSKYLGGSSFYFGKPRAIFRKSLNKRIQDEFDGDNYDQLARKYEYSERNIRNIVDNRTRADLK